MKTTAQLFGNIVLLVGAVSSFGQPTNPAPSIRAHYISLMVIAGIIAILQFWFRWSRGAAILERWARSNDFRLLESERPWIIWKGPFAWAAKSGSQVVYRIKVRDSRGEVLTGWARVGGPFLGLLSSQVDVKWDSIRRPAPTMRDLADMQKGAIPIAGPSVDEIYQRSQCVACRHPIPAGTKFCPNCDWTQPG